MNAGPFAPPGLERLVLASRSPRRADILRGLGLDFVVDAPDADVERSAPVPEAAGGVAAARSRAKCLHVAARHDADAVVLGADTLVVLDGAILGKPRDVDEARRHVARLAGRAHEVVTGVAAARGGRVVVGVEVTRVWFRRLAPREIDAYARSGEGLDKAGAYAAQGLGAGLIERVDGCFYNVVGLPVARTLALVADVLRGAGTATP